MLALLLFALEPQPIPPWPYASYGEAEDREYSTRHCSVGIEACMVVQRGQRDLLKAAWESPAAMITDRNEIIRLVKFSTTPDGTDWQMARMKYAALLPARWLKEGRGTVSTEFSPSLNSEEHSAECTTYHGRNWTKVVCSSR